MLTYPKIDTLYERDDDFKIKVGIFKRPVVKSIWQWHVTEKVDGTNIRIHYSVGRLNVLYPKIGGRTDKAQLSPKLVEHINTTIPRRTILDILQEKDLECFTLYGEGYGAGIQKGGNYRSDQGFILFDVLINNKLWLPEQAVTETAERLGIPRAPYLGVLSLPEITKMAEEGFDSRCSEKPQQAEGIVGKTLEPLYDNRGKRLIIKLKTSDFK